MLSGNKGEEKLHVIKWRLVFEKSRPSSIQRKNCAAAPIAFTVLKTRKYACGQTNNIWIPLSLNWKQFDKLTCTLNRIQSALK